MSFLNYGLIIILLHAGLSGLAQTTAQSEVKQHIEHFFEAFHKKDSTVLKSLVKEGLMLQTMGTDTDGNHRLRSDSFEEFLSSIMQIPDTLNYREELLKFNIQVDGPMAHAWTPYRFWIGDQLSHCGVNSFQLFNDGSRWMIIYLADTRRREDCND